MNGEVPEIKKLRKYRAIAANGRYAPPDLGPCCGCGSLLDVRVVLQLSGKCPTPGKGWGCAICGLDPEGAVAVLCGECEGRYAIGEKEIANICTGSPAVDGRTPIHQMRGTHEHNLALHVFADGGFGGED